MLQRQVGLADGRERGVDAPKKDGQPAEDGLVEVGQALAGLVLHVESMG
jgi:hypothetical protein